MARAGAENAHLMDGENEQGLERLQWNRVGKANAWSLPDRTMSHCAESKAFHARPPVDSCQAVRFSKLQFTSITHHP